MILDEGLEPPKSHIPRNTTAETRLDCFRRPVNIVSEAWSVRRKQHSSFRAGIEKKLF